MLKVGKAAKTQVINIAFMLEFIKLLKNKKSFGEGFFFPYSAKYFDRNFKYLL